MNFENKEIPMQLRSIYKTRECAPGRLAISWVLNDFTSMVFVRINNNMHHYDIAHEYLILNAHLFNPRKTHSLVNFFKPLNSVCFSFQMYQRKGKTHWKIVLTILSRLLMIIISVSGKMYIIFIHLMYKLSKLCVLVNSTLGGPPCDPAVHDVIALHRLLNIGYRLPHMYGSRLRFETKWPH